MKKIAKEFKEFIARGNVMDMAVGIIIGAAFKAIVDSLVADIISPLIGMAGGLDFSQYSLKLNEEATLNYGNFITAIINFLIMAIIIFFIVKAFNKISTIGKKEEVPADPTEKECPYCKSMIPIGATKCAHCTSDLS